MMEAISVQTSLSKRSSIGSDSCWVRVEQILPEEVEDFANIADVYNLWMTAATGNSATALRPSGCPVEFDGSTTRVFLGFYVWPSSPDLPYTLTVSLGTLGDHSVVRQRRSFSAVVDNADRFALPYYVEDVSVFWETPAYNIYGEVVLPAPQPRLVDGIWLLWEEKLFGVIYVLCRAYGYSVILTMEFDRAITTRPLTDNEIQTWRSVPGGGLILTPAPKDTYDSHMIKDIKNAIEAHSPCGGDAVDQGDIETTTWTEETTEIVIPDCVKSALELCPGDLDDTEFNCENVPTKKVYYNSCTGSVLGTEDGVGGQSFCSRVDTSPTGSQPWLPKVEPL